MPRVLPQILGEQPREKWAAPGSGCPQGGASEGAGIWGRFLCAGRGLIGAGLRGGEAGPGGGASRRTLGTGGGGD